MLNVQSGFEHRVLNTVKKVDGVEEAYISYGVYDIAAKVRTYCMDDLKDLIQNKLRQINGVMATSSMILVER